MKSGLVREGNPEPGSPGIRLELESVKPVRPTLIERRINEDLVDTASKKVCH